ncbi:MAG: PDZ domain-containing protein [Planctomycetota bacterium]|nr:PDZ domain-containing protein [Planctomycetota bacterium]
MKKRAFLLSCLVLACLPLLFWTVQSKEEAHAEGSLHYRVVSFKTYKNEIQLQNLLNHYANSGWEYLGTTPQRTGGIFRKKSKAKFIPIIIVLGLKGTRPYLGLFTKDTKDGLLVTKIENNGPSSQAGVQVGCLITEIDGLKATQENLKNTFKALVNGQKKHFTLKARQSHGITYFRAVLP